MIEELLAPREDVELLGVVAPGLFENPADVPGKPDALIDFSYPGNLEYTLLHATQTGAAAVIGTTGLSAAQVERIRAGIPSAYRWYTTPTSPSARRCCARRSAR